MAQRLYEAGAGGNIQKLVGQIAKAISAVQKAQSAVLDAADSVDEILVEATAIGGKVSEIAPQHAKNFIRQLTDIAEKNLGSLVDGNGQNTLSGLKELILNIPLRDTMPDDAETRRAQIATQPNLSNGPQSAISENMSFEEIYRSTLREDARNVVYDSNNLSFDALKEASIFGQKYEDDMMSAVNMRMAKPIQAKKITERLRARAEDDMFEEGEELQESGSLDFNNLRAFGGTDGMNISFGALNEGMNMVDNT